jgi:hypothetical protein
MERPQSDVKLSLRIGSDDTVAGKSATERPPKIIVTARCLLDLKPRT